MASFEARSCSAIPLVRSLSFAQGKPRGFLLFSGFASNLMTTADREPIGPWPAR